MSNKIKKVISGLMCMALLAVYAVPVNAAQYVEDMGIETFSECNHVHVDVTQPGPEYTSAGSSTHHKITYVNYTCTDCNTLIRSYRYDNIENHSWSYRDLGHADMYHNYEVVCRQCYHTEKAVIYCPNENGPHNKP